MSTVRVENETSVNKHASRYTSECRLVENYPATNFSEHHFEKTFRTQSKISHIWEWLNTPDTFIKGQIFPFRVEFVSPDGGEANFRQGVHCIHHGPFMSFAGIIGELKPMTYRDLQYFYGSYALSFRFIRPTRLQFWLEEDGDDVLVTVAVTSYVRRGWHKVWTIAQSFFWPSFGWGLRRASI